MGCSVAVSFGVAVGFVGRGALPERAVVPRGVFEAASFLRLVFLAIDLNCLSQLLL
jgi:hypothetical protein